MAPTIPIEFAGQKEAKRRLFSQKMGKAKKYSKRNFSEHASDHRYDVETMAKLEGHERYGCLDSEMTTSEDFSAPKRRCVSANADGSDSLRISKEIFTVSKMSKSERMDMTSRLRLELERVRELQKKFLPLGSGAPALSPLRGIRNYADEQMRQAPEETFCKSLGISGSKAKKGVSRRKGSTGKNTSSRPKSVKAVAGTSTASVMQQCETLLSRLMSHQYSWIFNEPVDVVKLNIPDYFTVIKNPMDLGTVKKQLAACKYLSPLEFAADVRLTFANAITYNPPGNDVHIMAKSLSKLFENRWKTIEKKLPAIDAKQLPTGSALIGSAIKAGNPPGPAITAGKSPAKYGKVCNSKIEQEPFFRVMTDEEKNNLNSELEALLEDLPDNISDFLREQILNEGQTAEDEIEIDIYTFSDEILFKLRKLLDEYLLTKQQGCSKAEPCEVKFVNDSGFNNSPRQLSDVHADEEIDIIGGDEAPRLDHPPPDMVQGVSNRSFKDNSSSSSSSDSGSSSSDSDSGGSLRRDFDSQKLDKLEDQRTGDLQAKEALNRSSDSQDIKLDPEDVQNCGENGAGERQISPERLHRAALLKSRFADTILKAREKALDKGEKGDSEKLRIDREELEKWRREEKVRLQAEAKAAEEAQRKAEAQAAAENKRKREQEREAARQALLQMEKTVDINENSQFMEDIERLRAASRGDELLRLEITPDHGNSLDSYKVLGNTNPLEQLGLYMKMDDEYEDENDEPPQSGPMEEKGEVKEAHGSTLVHDKDIEDGGTGDGRSL